MWSEMKLIFLNILFLYSIIVTKADTRVISENEFTNSTKSNLQPIDIIIDIPLNLTDGILDELNKTNVKLDSLRNEFESQKHAIDEITSAQNDIKQALAQLTSLILNNSLTNNNNNNNNNHKREEVLQNMQNCLENAQTTIYTLENENEQNNNNQNNIIKQKSHCSGNNLPSNCAEAMCSQFDKDGIYRLKIANSELNSFQVYCKRYNNTGWTIIQRRQDGSVDFERNWNSYKKGFGEPNGEYWLGLERLHAMTKNQNYELWIQLESYQNGTLNLFFPAIFKVGSEAEFYKIIPVKSTIDIMKYLDVFNGRFSTIDKFESLKNYAETETGGWWFEDGGRSNLNGQYFSYANRQTPGGIYWSWWLDNESLKYVHMAIRPV